MIGIHDSLGKEFLFFEFLFYCLIDVSNSVPASIYCNAQLLGPFQQMGLNPYDVRRTCDRSKDGDLCYKEMGWIDTYLNKPEVKKALGVVSDLEFQSTGFF